MRISHKITSKRISNIIFYSWSKKYLLINEYFLKIYLCTIYD